VLTDMASGDSGTAVSEQSAAATEETAGNRT